MSSHCATIVSILTPAGRGAVAVVVVEGPRTVELVEQFFRPHYPPSLSERLLNRIVYGHWGDESAEDVIVVRRSAVQIEVHCHGGRAASRRIVEDLVSVGAIEESWTKWVARRESSAIAAEARRELTQAVTNRTAEILVEQYQGALEKSLREILMALENTNVDQSVAIGLIEKILVRASLGLHLAHPWRVVIAGPPNVGKSSLVNVLVGYERAIVFNQPGTTRDVVTALMALAGWPIELCDTVGLRGTVDPLEAAGVERARQQAAAADCLLLVFDVSQPWTAAEQELLDAWPAAIVVHNKADLPPTYQPDSLAPDSITTSAATGAGLDLLSQKIMQRLVPFEPSPGDPVPFTLEQFERLQAARAALQAGEACTARGHLLSLLASRPIDDDAPTKDPAPAVRQ